MTALTRRYRFSASHRLHVPSFTESVNTELYGKCNNPYGHGHNYVLDVTVQGKVDASTGRVIAPGVLDRYVEERVVSRLDHRDMNHDVPEFDGLVPTTENLTKVIEQQLRTGWTELFPEADLQRIRIQETRRNSFELKKA